MRAIRPTLLAVGLMAALTGGAAFAAEDGADLIDAMRLDAAHRQASTGPDTPADQSDRVTPPTDLANLNSSDVHVVDARQAVRGKDPDLKCITVSGIRPWRKAKRQLRRLGYRRLHVIRYVPRRLKPINNSKTRARCSGGWFLVRAKKGRTSHRVALDAATLRIAARVRR